MILEFDKNLPKNRLGLSQWLFDANNPLTARVFVNRIWQMHFGKGLTTTTDDLGNQGRLPATLNCWIGCPIISWITIGILKTS